MTMSTEMQSAIAAIKPEDFEYKDLSDIASVCGIPVVLQLIENFGGSHLYISKRNVFNQIVRKIIIEKFDGTNARDLARICSCSTRHVLRVVNEEDLARQRKKRGPAAGPVKRKL